MRDLLAGQKPKDFDISTSAPPEEVKRIFQRQCLLIGRRFRLAHIRFGHKKIIEVATFRSGDIDDEKLIVRDNSYGTPEEDAFRRDFTINALCYDPSTKEVIDFTGGWEDIQHHTMRSIGDSIARFKQDPVRMIRLLKFMARYDFHVEKETLNALRQCTHEILKSSQARILEELLRMLESGHSCKFFELMLEHGLLELLLPWMASFCRGPFGKDLFQHLETMDDLIRSGHKHFVPTDRAVLLSALIFPILYREILKHFHQHNQHLDMSRIVDLTHSIIHGIDTASFPHFTKRLSGLSAFLLATQFHLTPLAHEPNFRSKIVKQRDFCHALQFLFLRTQIFPELGATYEHWAAAWMEQAPPNVKRPRRRRRK